MRGVIAGAVELGHRSMESSQKRPIPVQAGYSGKPVKGRGRLESPHIAGECAGVRPGGRTERLQPLDRTSEDAVDPRVPHCESLPPMTGGQPLEPAKHSLQARVADTVGSRHEIRLGRVCRIQG